MKYNDGKFIFLKYWYLGEPYFSMFPNYRTCILPGMKEGISGTVYSGNNIGIIKNIAEEKKDVALEVLKFYTSKEYQRNGFENRLFTTGINEFWDDEELCKNGFCEHIHDIQFTTEPKFIQEEPDYKKKYQKYIYQYLYENKTIDETLKHINDIKKIYYISLSTEDSYIGLFCFIFLIVVSMLMMLSLIFLFKDSFYPFFTFLTKDFWIITIIGSILYLWVPIIHYGPIKPLKCHLEIILMSIGYTFSVCPSLYKLISIFPKENKISIWVNNNKYMFIIYNILLDVLLNSLSLIKPFTSQSVLVEDGESFKLCKFNGEYSIVIILVYKIIIILSMLLLIFIEWNYAPFKYDMRFIVSTLYIDILSLILIYLFHIIKIKNYVTYFVLQAIITSFNSISNHIFLYNGRVFLIFVKDEDLKIEKVSTNNYKFVIKSSSASESNIKKFSNGFTDNTGYIDNSNSY